VAEFWVGIKGDLAAEQAEALKSAGIAVDDLRRVSAGYAPQWHTLRTFLRASAADESEARAEIARVLDLDADDLIAGSYEFF
jgi:hypothetical protein